jgi:hypothetical protein
MTIRAGHTTRAGERTNSCKVWSDNIERETEHEMKHGWEDNIKTDFEELMYEFKWDVGIWTGSIWFRIGTGGGHL